MDSAIWVAIIGLLGSFITVGGTIVVAIISKNTNKKITKIEDVKTEILQEIEKNRNGYEKEIGNHILENDKTYLTDFLSDVEAHEPKSEMQIRRAYEIKKEYNSLGGDSYVDDKWDELVRKGILKERRQEI